MQKFIVSSSLKDIEKLLEDHSFIRVHHSHIVNKNEINKYVKGEGGYLITRMVHILMFPLAEKLQLYTEEAKPVLSLRFNAKYFTAIAIPYSLFLKGINLL